MKAIPLVLLAASLTMVAGGCQRGIDPDRGQKLLTLAQEEAAQVKEAKARLTRELNIADYQINHDHKGDARVTLAGAIKTLSEAPAQQMDDLGRISGWVSVSELSRRADDKGLASTACKKAIDVLRTITPVEKRCDFVEGVANEAHELWGDAPAKELLVEGGTWARQIDDVARRRMALVIFANKLFAQNDYKAGQQVLRNDDDAAWRSDTLLAMARGAEKRKGILYESRAATGVAADKVMDVRGAQAAQAQSPSVLFGQKVDFRNTYQQQK